MAKLMDSSTPNPDFLEDVKEYNLPFRKKKLSYNI